MCVKSIIYSGNVRRSVNMIKEILEYNKQFVEEKKYEKYKTSKYPDKKIAILSLQSFCQQHLV